MKVLILLDAWNLIRAAEQSFGKDSRLSFAYILKKVREKYPDADLWSVAFLSRYLPSMRDHLDGNERVLERGRVIGAEHDKVAHALRVAGYDKVVVKRTEYAMEQLLGTHDTDVDLAVYALTYDADVVYVGSGDGDFIPLYDALRTMGRQVNVVAYRSSINQRVSVHIDQLIILGEDSLLPSQEDHETPHKDTEVAPQTGD